MATNRNENPPQRKPAIAGRTLFLIAVAEFLGLTLWSALRVATGMALACVYPPGLKIAAGWFLERRGTALGIAVGA